MYSQDVALNWELKWISGGGHISSKNSILINQRYKRADLPVLISENAQDLSRDEDKRYWPVAWSEMPVTAWLWALSLVLEPPKLSF